jgi:hypothetical protein
VARGAPHPSGALDEVASSARPTFTSNDSERAHLALAAVAQAGTLSGTVVNRTTGKPAPNIVLNLLRPTQNMTELATTTSDAQGNFSVTKDNIGGAPILIRATFHDVSFNTFAPPDRPKVQVEIYDISKDVKTITVPSHSSNRIS